MGFIEAQGKYARWFYRPIRQGLRHGLSISQYSFSTQDDETYVNPLRDFTRCPSDSYNIRLLIINNYVYESLMTWCYSV